MYCKHCGQELEENVVFCHNCGKAVNDLNETTFGTTSLSFRFEGKNFFYAILFFTLSTVFTFLSGMFSGSVNIPILQIFVIISFWKLNNCAKNGAPITQYVSPLKTLCIVVKIQRILIWIIVGVFSVVGILMLVIGASANAELIDSFVEGINEGMIKIEGIDALLGGAMTLLLQNIGLFLIIFGAIFFVVAAVCLVFNLTMYKSYYKCVESFEQSARVGIFKTEKQDSVRKWLVFNLVCSCISALGQINVSGTASLVSVGAVAFEICYLIFFIRFLKEEI